MKSFSSDSRHIFCVLCLRCEELHKHYIFTQSCCQLCPSPPLLDNNMCREGDWMDGYQCLCVKHDSHNDYFLISLSISFIIIIIIPPHTCGFRPSCPSPASNLTRDASVCRLPSPNPTAPPTGLAVPPRAAGCRGDAVVGGADERGAGRRGPGRPLEAAVQRRHRPQQRGGRVRPAVRRPSGGGGGRGEAETSC